MTPKSRHRLGVFPLHRSLTQEAKPHFKIMMFSNEVNGSPAVKAFPEQQTNCPPGRGEKAICWDLKAFGRRHLTVPPTQIFPQHAIGSTNQSCLQLAYQTDTHLCQLMVTLIRPPCLRAASPVSSPHTYQRVSSFSQAPSACW